MEDVAADCLFDYCFGSEILKADAAALLLMLNIELGILFVW